ncbi:hypothetical protein FNW02_28605 [Komarekiella sp. 'clone 1']|uniref:Tetratricopeptide repeat protein n=1 Tax=Komarekiella delphini-convector SJRDD-AB1 TaxID=2593771 RepID=A0AA40T2W2_9NOST|nr:hypothetical protein [Komarekiella delphini-convector]MBD6619675.1 hypothetical protein [Komarekiella delphini-convector SJRDD-AB1]
MLDLQTILKFYQDHKDFINNLITDGLAAMIPVITGFLWWLRWRHRQCSIACYSQGIALSNLGRKQEAIASYENNRRRASWRYRECLTLRESLLT